MLLHIVCIVALAFLGIATLRHIAIPLLNPNQSSVRDNVHAIIKLLPLLLFAFIAVGLTAPKHHISYKPQISSTEFQSKKVANWPVWEKEVSKFPWRFLVTETVYIIDGVVEVAPDIGYAIGEPKVVLRKGDMATFPAGTDTVWNVIKPVRKYYLHEGSTLASCYHLFVLYSIKFTQRVRRLLS